MKTCRIVKITYPDGRVRFQIQQKHWLFKWWWRAASFNYIYPYITDTFDTLEEAEKVLWFFEGKKKQVEVIKEVN
jgi:hypothetical protein